MGTEIPTKDITSKLRSGTINKFLKTAKARRAGVAEAPIQQIQKNIRTMGDNDFETLMKFFAYFWKSLPVDPAKVDDVLKQDKERAEKAGFKDKAPVKQLETFKEQYKAIMTIVTANVNSNFDNWGILARAMEDVMSPLAAKVIRGGNLEDKRMVQKGFFVFYSDEEELASWLSLQMNLYIETIKFVLGATEMNIGNNKFDPPKTAEEWATWFNGKKVTQGKRLSTKSARQAFKAFTDNVVAAGGFGNFNVANFPELDARLEVMALIQPARFLAARDQVRINGANIDTDWVDRIIRIYTPLNKQIKRNFNLKAVDKTIENGADLNEAFRETVSVARQLIAQYRTRRYGGNTNRLGANQARKVAKATKVKLD